ncbi:MAG: hypothetical protein AAGH57_01515 [Pseudomonadota bacterium]
MAHQEVEAADSESEGDAAETRPRRKRAAPKDTTRAASNRKPRAKKSADDDEPAEIDSSVLPPAISGGPSTGSEDGDALEAVG